MPTDTLPERPAVYADPAASDPDLWSALQRLPTKQRQALAYHHIVGLPFAEIADYSATPPTPRAAPPPTDSRHYASTTVRTKPHEHQHL